MPTTVKLWIPVNCKNNYFYSISWRDSRVQFKPLITDKIGKANLTNMHVTIWQINLNIDNSETDLSKVSSRLLYNAFKKRKQVLPSAQKKMNEKFPELQVSWKEIYSLPFVVTIETKIREFQYKILNNIVFTNEKLFRLKMIDSPLCLFCKREVESLEHLLFLCEVTKMFWSAFCTWLAEC